jgi:DNA-binding IclR family transcriptional regulator
MSKATVHRLLTALEKKRFITKNKVAGRYCLDLSFMEIASLLSKEANNHQNVTNLETHNRELPSRRQFKNSYASF